MPPIPILGRKPPPAELRIGKNMDTGQVILKAGDMVFEFTPEGAVAFAQTIMAQAGHDMVLLQDKAAPPEGESDDDRTG